jgi:hypothetical protein
MHDARGKVKGGGRGGGQEVEEEVRARRQRVRALGKGFRRGGLALLVCKPHIPNPPALDPKL